MDNPKFFILWLEMGRMGTIRKFTRVYEHEDNMNSLLLVLAQDPKVYSLQFGTGSPNRKCTAMKVETISTYKMEEIEDEHEDDTVSHS